MLYVKMIGNLTYIYHFCSIPYQIVLTCETVG